MGFLDDIGSFMKAGENGILRAKYRVRTPSDAVGAADRIIYGRCSDSSKAADMRPLVAWLVRLAESGNDEAEDALRSIRSLHRKFLEENDIESEF